MSSRTLSLLGKRFAVSLLAVFVIVMGLVPLAAAAESVPTLVTDKADYAPEETVLVTGSGFTAGATYAIPVIRPDGTVVKGDGTFTPGWDAVTADASGAFVYSYQLDGVLGSYEVRVYAEPWDGDINGSAQIVAATTFTDGPDYKHWADIPGDWKLGDLNAQNSQYFEGEVVPHYFEVGGLQANSTYTFKIYYDYYNTQQGACGFDYMAQYNVDRTISNVNASEDTALPEGHGNFYTSGAVITAVTSPHTDPDGERWVQVTFKATGPKAKFYWGLHLAMPGAVSSCTGAHTWPGSSLHTSVGLGDSSPGLHKLSIAANAVIAGTISGFKWNDQDGDGVFDTGEPKLSDWTIKLCSSADCSSQGDLLQTTVTDSTYARS